MINLTIQKSIEASQVVGRHGLCILLTSNPLSGYEGMPFEKAVNQARKLLNANVFPESTVFKHGKRVKLMKIYF
jgi:uncharacterized protein YbcC (UPF0753/DUF2309 family)